MGETLHGSDYRTGFGGKGANQAVAAKRLSDSGVDGANVSVSIVTRVGDDGDGKSTLENFRANGVSVDFVSVEGGGGGGGEKGRPTGVAPITVDTNTGDNSIIVVMGANDALSPAHVSETAAAAEAIASAAVVLCQMEIPRETTLAALRTARGGGGVAQPSRPLTVLNTAPAPSNPPLSRREAEAFFSLADIVCPNQPELAMLTASLADTAPPGDGDADAAVAAAASELLRYGARRVLVTLGGDGAMLVSGEPIGDVAASSEALAACLLGSSPSSSHASLVSVLKSVQIGSGGGHAGGAYHWAIVPGTDDRPIDTVGAGDTFMGAFVATYVQAKQQQQQQQRQLQGGEDEREEGFIDDDLVLLAMARANAAAGISVTRPGTQTATPYASEMPF